MTPTNPTPAAILQLLPCPFCGNPDLDPPLNGRGGWHVRCSNPHCTTAGPTEPTDVRAIRAWNRRAAATPPVQEAEPVARMHPEDGRVIPEETYATGARDGGASWSSVRPYTIKLYAHPPTGVQATEVASPVVGAAIGLLFDMDRGVLRMPINLALSDVFARAQFYGRVQSLLDRLDALATPSQQEDAQPVPQWQPIETAPQHKEVLLWREDAGAFAGIFTAAEEFLSGSDAANLSVEDLETQDWFGGDYTGSWRLDGEEKPTHWMPLPDAPVSPQSPQEREG